MQIDGGIKDSSYRSSLSGIGSTSTEVHYNEKEDYVSSPHPKAKRGFNDKKVFYDTIGNLEEN